MVERFVKFESGFDCINFECKFRSKRCAPDGGGSHGKHGLEIGFYVKGEKGVVQFKVFTGWLPHYVKKSEIGYRDIPHEQSRLFPMASDLGYHSYVPHYKGQTQTSGKCSLLDNKPCYYDGSGLNANDAFYTLTNAGEEALWLFLEQYYLCCFENGKYPEAKEYEMPQRSIKE